MAELHRTWVAGLSLVVATSSCSVVGPFGDKAGGPVSPAVLQLATASSQLEERPAIEYFIRRVATLSGGNVRVQVRYNWGGYAPNAEQQIVHAVSTGTVDLGVVGSRVFDTMGLKAFRALTAPMLIDSYPLENAVIRSDMAGQMLGTLAALHLAGLALIANGLREPVGVRHPLLGPATWRGIAFGTYLSDVQEEAIRAVGATPRVAFGPLRDRLLAAGQLQGFEFNLLAYRIKGYWSQARYITANVALWPQTDVLMANPDRLSALTPQQRGWLGEAAAQASDSSAGMMAHIDASLLPTLCGRGVRFADASPGELASLREAFTSVYSSLEADPGTRSFIARIQAIERTMPEAEPLPVPNRCVVSAST